MTPAHDLKPHHLIFQMMVFGQEPRPSTSYQLEHKGYFTLWNIPLFSNAF